MPGRFIAREPFTMNSAVAIPAGTNITQIVLPPILNLVLNPGERINFRTSYSIFENPDVGFLTAKQIAFQVQNVFDTIPLIAELPVGYAQIDPGFVLRSLTRLSGTHVGEIDWDDLRYDGQGVLPRSLNWSLFVRISNSDVNPHNMWVTAFTIVERFDMKHLKS